MNTKYEKYEQLSEQTLAHLLDNADTWLGYLNTVSHMYKYSFDEQLMIYAQRPDTTACASFNFWAAADKMNLLIKKGSNGIALLNKQSRKLYYVFAVEDTHQRDIGSKNPEKYRWKVTTEKENDILEMIRSRYGYHSDSLSGSLVAMSIKETDRFFARYEMQLRSKADEIGIDSSNMIKVFRDILQVSTAYITCRRCGINTNDLLKPNAFEMLKNFDSRLTVVLGQALNTIARSAIRQVELTVGLDYIQKGSKENEQENIRSNSRGRGNTSITESREWNSVHSGSGNTDVSSVYGSGRGRSGDQALGTNEGEVPDGIQGSDISGNAVEQHTDTTSSGYRRQSIQDAAADRSVNGGSRGRDGGAEDNRSAEMGRSDDQLQSISGGNNSEGIDLRLIDDSDNGTVDSKSLLFYDDEIINSEIEAELLQGPGNVNGKFEIQEKLHSDKLTDDELVSFIKNKYGSGSHTSSPIMYSTYDSNGFEFSFKTPDGNQMLRLSWNDVAKKIRDLIDNKAYISESDIQSHVKQAHFVVNNADPKVYQDKIKYAQTVINKYDGLSNVVEDNELYSQLSMFDDKSNNKINTDTDLNKQKSDESEKIKFQYHDGTDINGGAKIKFRMNVEAIRTLKAVESENRAATSDEQLIMSRYVGWGGIPQVFDEKNDKWHDEYTQLTELLNDAEYTAARRSTQSAFYTAPVVVDSMYKALSNNGFEGGKILEPAMGVGNFFALMPEKIRGDSDLYGVELDSISGRMAKQLHQDANIDITGFEKTEFNDDSFDLAIGNVPFGASKLNEKRYNQYNFNIHDHFFAKALDKVKPGGIIAFVTSKGTLDKKNPDVRKYLAKRAELVGAVRLPSGAFHTTEVTSDIIFLQKREKAIETEPDWVHVGQNKNGFTVNSYFIDHPDMVLGQIVKCNKLYGGEDDTMCVPFEDVELKDLLDSAIKKIKFTLSDEKYVDNVINNTDIYIPADIKKFSYTVVNEKLFYYTDNKIIPVKKNKNEKCIRSLVDIRDTLRTLINAQLEDASNEIIQKLQDQLNTKYDSFKDNFGNISDSNNQKLFSEDVSLPLLLSLENTDKVGKIQKAAIFTKRTINPKIEVNHVDTSLEALAISISKKATVDLNLMSELTGFN